MTAETNLAKLTDRAQELALSKKLTYDDAIEFRRLVAESYEQGRVDRNAELEPS